MGHDAPVGERMPRPSGEELIVNRSCRSSGFPRGILLWGDLNLLFNISYNGPGDMQDAGAEPPRLSPAFGCRKLPYIPNPLHRPWTTPHSVLKRSFG
jgi:hypothetical protein